MSIRGQELVEYFIRMGAWITRGIDPGHLPRRTRRTRAMSLSFDTLSLDRGQAESIARLLRPTLDQVGITETSVPTVLAGLTLAAAAIVARSGLKRNPASAAFEMGRLLVDAVTTNQLPW